MRTLAMILAIAYVVGASLFIPGAEGRRSEPQISVHHPDSASLPTATR